MLEKRSGWLLNASMVFNKGKHHLVMLPKIEIFIKNIGREGVR